MKYYFLILFLVNSLFSISQDSLSFNEFLNIRNGDTLVIDIKNVDCRSNSGDRFLIFQNDSNYTCIKINNFHSKLLIDGMEFKTDDAKQDFLIKNTGLIEYCKMRRTKMEYKGFINFMDQLKTIVTSNQSEKIKVAGTYTYLTLSLPDKIYSKEFNGHIKFSVN